MAKKGWSLRGYLLVLIWACSESLDVANTNAPSGCSRPATDSEQSRVMVFTQAYCTAHGRKCGSSVFYPVEENVVAPAHLLSASTNRVQMLSSGQHYYFPTNLFDHWGRSKAPSNATRRSCNICRKALKEVVEYNEQQQQEQAPPVPAQQQQQLALGLGAADARVVGGAAAGNSMGAKPAENGIARRGVRDKKQNRRYID